MRRSFLIPLISFFAVNAYSQSGILKGILKDSIDHAPVESATVSLIYAKDSTPNSFAISDTRGGFTIRNLELGNYICYITATGYATAIRSFSISPDKRIVDFDTIWLRNIPKSLNEVVVVSAPVTVKGDTLEYNAGSFKVSAGAQLEELLRSLPGLALGKNGKLTFNGEPVSQLMIDGLPFFPGDLPLAVKSLPADVIERIQLIDQQTKENTIRRIDDGSKQKILNLKIKKGKSNGIFGNAGAGYGTDKRYMAQLNQHIFKNTGKLSFTGNANNINDAGFTGKTGNSTGGGINETKSGNVNYSAFTSQRKVVSFNVAYFFNKNVSLFKESASKEMILEDSSLFINTESANSNTNINHRLHVEMEYKPDTLNFLRVATDYNSNKGTSDLKMLAFTFDNHEAKITSNSQSEIINNTGYNYSTGIVYVRSFKKRGQFLSLNMSFNNYYNSGSDVCSSRINYYSSQRSDTVQRKTNFNTAGSAGNIALLYAHPLGKGYFAEASFKRNETLFRDQRNTFDYNFLAGDFNLANSGLTNGTRNINIAYNYEAGIRINKTRYNAYAGLILQQQKQVNNSVNNDSMISIRPHYFSWQPRIFMNYSFSAFKRIDFNYAGNTHQPTAIQLSSFTDSTNRLYIHSGNPNLKPEYIQKIGIVYTNRNFSSWAPSINSVYTSVLHKITMLTTYSNDGAIFNKPFNVDGVFNLLTNISLNIPARRKMLNADFFISPSINRDINFINGQRNDVRSFGLVHGISLFFHNNHWLDFFMHAGFSYTRIDYSIQPMLNSKLYGTEVNGNMLFALPGGWRLKFEFDINQNSFKNDSYNKTIILIDGDICKQLFKSKKAEIHLKGFDLLNENQEIYRRATENYIEAINRMTLRQYFIFSFNYNFSKFKIDALSKKSR